MPGVSGNSGSDESSTLLGTVASAIPIVGGIYNAIATGANNRKNREFSQHMYDQQRADSLADWNMNNAYNSPEQQMQRLREAGLNPNLVYGNGAVATSGGEPRSSNFGSYRREAPQVDIPNVMQSMLGLQLQKQQLANLKTQNTVMAADAALKVANTGYTLTKDNLGAFDLAYKQDTRATSMATMQARLRGIEQGNDIALNENDRRNALTASNLRQSAIAVLCGRAETARTLADTKRIYAQISNLEKDGQLKDISIDLEKRGIYPHDPLYMRMLGQFLGSQSSDSNVLNDPGNSLQPGSFLGNLFGTFHKGQKPW